MMGCLVQGWSATVNQCRQLTEPSVWLVSLSFSSAVNLLKPQKQDWEGEYLPDYSVYWKNNIQTILNLQFSSLQAIWTQWHYWREKKPTLLWESNACYQTKFLHQNPCKCILMWKVGKEKCFAKVNVQSILKDCTVIIFLVLISAEKLLVSYYSFIQLWRIEDNKALG